MQNILSTLKVLNEILPNVFSSREFTLTKTKIILIYYSNNIVSNVIVGKGYGNVQ